MRQYEPNFDSDSSNDIVDPVQPPVAPPVVNEGVTVEDIYYNGHLIPNGAYYKITK